MGKRQSTWAKNKNVWKYIDLDIWDKYNQPNKYYTFFILYIFTILTYNGNYLTSTVFWSLSVHWWHLEIKGVYIRIYDFNYVFIKVVFGWPLLVIVDDSHQVMWYNDNLFVLILVDIMPCNVAS